MGANMARRLRRGGVEVVGYNRTHDTSRQLEAEEGMVAAESLLDLVQQLTPPRIVWLMLPAGEVTERTIDELTGLLEQEDVIVDGGNANYHDSQRRGLALARLGVRFIDAGTSGGIWGLEGGYCLMVGGDSHAVALLEPALKALAPSPERGWAHVGPVGAGHYTKMIHNGIEYGVMAAYAEGFNILRHANIGAEAQAADAETAPVSDPEAYRFDFDIAEIAELWRRGSVIASWLLDLTAGALLQDPELSKFEGRVSDSGEGRWTIKAAIDEGVPAHVLSAALYGRFASRGEADFASKVLAAMRYEFGGHAEKVSKN